MDYGLQKWTMDYKNLKEEIISAICNKKKKALCCPKVEKRQTVKIKQIRKTIKTGKAGVLNWDSGVNGRKATVIGCGNS